MNNTINPSFRIRKKSKSKSVTNGIKLNKKDKKAEFIEEMKRVIRNYHYKEEKIKEERARVRWEIGGEID